MAGQRPALRFGSRAISGFISMSDVIARDRPLTLLIADDDATVRAFFRATLEGLAGRILEAADGREALAICEKQAPDLVLTDLRMPGLDGLALIERVLARSPLTPMIMVTGQGDVGTAVEAMKRGVTDYLTKPVDPKTLAERVKAIVETRVLPRRAVFSSRFLGAGDGRVLVTISPRMRAVLETIAMVRGTRSSVFIQGESGTGKEIIARAIHVGSPDGGRPFVAFNCGGIPEGVLESQLFGHVKGSFTGATADAPGLFRAASGGTLFLDEITEMPLHLQSKLLRAVQEREVLPVGGVAPVKVDIRLITATNRPLDKALAEGRLREDLFYRLAVVPILLPPLRERTEDIPVLTAFFSAAFAKQFDRPEKIFTPAALVRLTQFPWPGNIRELQNLVERLYASCPEERIDVANLPQPLHAPPASAAPPASLQSWEDAERQLIRQTLEATGGNRSEAARLLQIERQRLLRKIKKYGLDKIFPSDPPLAK
jgi:DNA-binding NtrC family response regulator